MDEKKIKKLENTLSALIDELDEKDILTKEKFDEQWKYIEDYQDLKGKLSGKEKKEGLLKIKEGILNVTKDNYRLAGFISFILLSYVRDKGFDRILNTISQNELFIKDNELKLFKNLKFAMEYKGHDVDHFTPLISLIENNINKKAEMQNKGFKSTLLPKEIESLFNQLKGKYIAENTNPEHFKAIFKDETLPTDFNKIEWEKSIPLFCCLLFGYKVEYENKFISFNGLIDKNTEHIYKRTIDFFSFGNRTVTNKTLSEKFSRLSNFNPPQNFNSLFEIIKTVQNSTV